MSENKNLKKFKKVLDWLKKDGDSDNSDLDYRLKQTSLSEKQKVLDFFTNTIDQAAHMSEDHKRLRSFLVDWYSSHRSIITQAKQNTDPFNLETDLLDELIRCFGFPYPEKLGTQVTKARFLLDLVALYHKKGTPEVLVKTLQTYFGLTDITLSEWWIHRKVNENRFVAKSKPVYPKESRKNRDFFLEVDYTPFVEDDPLWRITESELQNLYDSNKISLPSITPYVSMTASISLDTINSSLSILNRKLKESYEYWIQTGDLNRDMTLSKFDNSYSILEVFLAISYLFETTSGTTKDKEFLQYNGDLSPLDIPDSNGSRDDVDDVEYQMVIDEYNNISKRPITKTEREENLNIRQTNFRGDNNNTKTVPQLLSDPAVYLDQINPQFKNDIDQWLINNSNDDLTLLESIFLDFETSLNERGMMDGLLSYIVLGSPIFNRLGDVVDFFKPYRVRVRDFLLSFLISDPLGDSQLEEDSLFLALSQLFNDRDTESIILDDTYSIMIGQSFIDHVIDKLDANLRDDMLPYNIISYWNDNVNIYHNLFTRITQQLNHHSINLNSNYLMSIIEKFTERYDSLDSILKDDLIYRILQKSKDNIIVSEAVNKLNTSLDLVDKGPHVYDNSMARDEWLPIGINPGIFKDYLDTLDSIFLDKLDNTYTSNLIETTLNSLRDLNIVKSNINLQTEYGPFGLDNGIANEKLSSMTNVSFIERNQNVLDDLILKDGFNVQVINI